MNNSEDKILLKNLHVSSLNNSVVDILIEDGVIADINSSIDIDCTSYNCEGMIAYPGFVDVGTSLNEPGHEERETLKELEQSASNGGYTDLITLPHTEPITDTASMIKLHKRNSEELNVNIHPLGALSNGLNGKDISELIEMSEAGAVGFTQGYSPSEYSGFLMRGLEYVKSFQGIIVSMPYDTTIIPQGQIHEGIVSTRLGTTGIPTIAETSRIKRDLDLLKYTGSKLFVWNISSRESIELIREAKDNGLDVYCSVSYLHLIFTDNEMEGFDAYLKVLPPLRSEDDRKALIEACLDGTIDVITSQHRPWDKEHKVLEFQYAEFGTRSLDIVYAALNTFCPQITQSNHFVDLISTNSRKIFNLEAVKVQKGEKACLTLVDPKTTWSLMASSQYDQNTEFSIKNQNFQGGVVGVINHKFSSINI